ncbi:MAG: disulfide bond formation protein B [Rhodobacterales bacterium]|nr:disulfide bond formation protein B [Rhodobacterales bacterium]MDX5414142.1 disulfide bond formation protein B [Rhodobacterales bacterium]
MLGALAFQHIGGMAPCKLCIWQRWPHVAAIAIGAVAALAILPARLLAGLGVLAALTTAGIGAYHTGVERKWWEGPASCSGGSVGDQSAQDLFAQIMAAPLVRCDEVPWEMLGLSMASWNAVASLALAGIWLMAWRTAR